MQVAGKSDHQALPNTNQRYTNGAYSKIATIGITILAAGLISTTVCISLSATPVLIGVSVIVASAGAIVLAAALALKVFNKLISPSLQTTEKSLAVSPCKNSIKTEASNNDDKKIKKNKQIQGLKKTEGFKEFIEIFENNKLEKIITIINHVKEDSLTLNQLKIKSKAHISLQRAEINQKIFDLNTFNEIYKVDLDKFYRKLKIKKDADISFIPNENIQNYYNEVIKEYRNYSNLNIAHNFAMKKICGLSNDELYFYDHLMDSVIDFINSNQFDILIKHLGIPVASNENQDNQDCSANNVVITKL